MTTLTITARLSDLITALAEYPYERTQCVDALWYLDLAPEDQRHFAYCRLLVMVLEYKYREELIAIGKTLTFPQVFINA